ncbi:MAG: flagellar hook-basal body complex protein [Solirubrobacterales bacterium]
MSLYGALFSGVSGLSAQSSAMGAISDNISNVNTTGYKGSKVNFSTLVTKQVSLTNYSPGGVQSRPRHGIDVQGLLQATNSSTDVAISGQGFFVVNEAAHPSNGDMFAYTRAGSFKVDKEGFLQNVSGWYMQGWPLMASDRNPQASTVQIGNDVYMKAYMNDQGSISYINDNIVKDLRPLNLNEVGGTAAQTRNLRLGANLPNAAEVGFSGKIPLTIYDSLGGDADIQLNWTKTAQSRWDLETLPPMAAKSLVLKDSTGQIYSATGRLDFAATPKIGGAINFNMGGTTWTINNKGGQGGQVGNNMYVNPTSSSNYVGDLATAVNTAMKIRYEGVQRTMTPTSGTSSTMAQGSKLTITTALGVEVPIDLSGADPFGGNPTDAAALINAQTATTGITATVIGPPNQLELTNGNATPVTIQGTGDAWGFTGSILGNTDPLYAPVDSAVGAFDTYTGALGSGTSTLIFDSTTPATSIDVSGMTLAGAVAEINLHTSATGIRAFQNGGQIALYSEKAQTVNVLATGDMDQGGIGFNATQIVGQGRTYCEALAGTNSLVFRQFDSAVSGGITVSGLNSIDLTNGDPATYQGRDINTATLPNNSDGFTLNPIASSLATADAIEFDGNGNPEKINVSTMEIDWANGATDMTQADTNIGLFFGNIGLNDGVTQSSGTDLKVETKWSSQDGAKFGNFAGVSIGSDGIVTALFDNGVTKPVFQIPVATFVNPNGMESLTGNVFISTDNSGDPTLRSPGDAGAGQVNAASLEASTVDIGEEFTTMIVTQRAYSAAAKIITTSDEMLDELVRIKR